MLTHWCASQCKIHGAGPKCHDFFSLLYLCENVFGYATSDDIEAVSHLLLLPMSVAHSVVTILRVLAGPHLAPGPPPPKQNKNKNPTQHTGLGALHGLV